MGVILSVDLYSVQQDSKTADMGLKSKVGVAKKGTSSLRTTIPEGIVEYLNLKPGNSLDWTMEISKPLRIGFERSCKCPPNHINCLTAKEWIQSQVAIWEFFYEKRDVRDKNVHPAVFPIGLPKKCIQLFTHQGELVLDPFVGIGTTLVAAFDLNRNAVGFDLKKEYVEYANSRIAQAKLDNWGGKPQSSTIQFAIHDEAHNIPQYLQPQTVSLTVTSPPY